MHHHDIRFIQVMLVLIVVLMLLRTAMELL